MIEADLSETDLQYGLMKQFFNQARTRDAQVEEVSLLCEQNKLLKTIKAGILRRESEWNEQNLNNSIGSSANVKPYRPIMTPRGMKMGQFSVFGEGKTDRQSANTTVEEDYKFKRKSSFGRGFSVSEPEIEKALEQIQQKCDSTTIQLMRTLATTLSDTVKKLKQTEDSVQGSQKSEKQFQQLRLLQTEIDKKAFQYESRIRTLESQNATLKESLQSRKAIAGVQNDREKQLSKVEMSLLLKQKLISQDMKRLNSKINLLKKQEESAVQQKRAGEQIWDKIVNHFQTVGDDFKVNVYTKCKESLMSQRKHLQEEISELDIQHEYIQRIISQMQSVL